MASSELAGEEGAFEIHRERRVKVGFGHIFGVVARGDAGVVYQDVEMAKGLGRLRYSCLNLRQVAHIEGDLHHSASALVDFVDEVDGGVRAAKAKDDVGTCVSQGDRDRTAQATRRSGDEGGAAGEVERLLGGWSHHRV